MILTTTRSSTHLFVLLALTILVAAGIAGCGPRISSTTASTSTFSGTRFAMYDGASEKLILDADGSYKQFIETTNHRSLTNISKWTPAAPPQNATPGSQWFILYGYVAPWDWAKSKPNAVIQHSNMQISTQGFKGATPQTAVTETSSRGEAKRKLPAGVYPAAILISLIFTVFWILAVVSAASRGQIGWLIILVLFPCTTLFYAVLNMVGGAGQRR